MTTNNNKSKFQTENKSRWILDESRDVTELEVHIDELDSGVGLTLYGEGGACSVRLSDKEAATIGDHLISKSEE